MSAIDTEELLAAVESNIRVAAAQVARKYRGFVTFQDMVQEANIWVIQHPRTVTDRLADGRRGQDRITGQLAKHLHSVARTERASVSGYRPEDEVFYSRGMLEMVLPAIWDDDLLVHPPVEQRFEGKSVADPSEGGNWQIMVAEVRVAYEKADLAINQRLALTMRYHDQMQLAEIARVLEVSVPTVSGYIRAALNRMVNFLGGTDPHHSCGYDCECGRGYSGPGSRRSMSNATARAITDGNYDQ